jgi:hypothetical protein
MDTRIAACGLGNQCVGTTGGVVGHRRGDRTRVDAFALRISQELINWPHQLLDRRERHSFRQSDFDCKLEAETRN